MRKKILIALGGLLLVLVVVAIVLDVPRFVIGLAMYGGQVREGTLKVGDPAPSFILHEVSGEATRQLDEWVGEQPLVLIFGSFT